jgi:hypothetical protein
VRKVRETSSQSISQAWWCALAISGMREVQIGGSWSRQACAKMKESISKPTKAKRAGHVALVVEHLPGIAMPRVAKRKQNN